MSDDIRILSRHQYDAVKVSRAHDDRLARRLGLPVELVQAIRRDVTLREAVDSQIPKGTRVRLETAMDADSRHEPRVGELGTVTGADDGGTLHVAWDGGSNLGVLSTDRISVEDAAPTPDKESPDA